MTYSLIQLAKNLQTEEKQRCILDLQSTSKKLEQLASYCLVLVSAEEKKPMHEVTSHIGVLVKQVMTYAEYGQPLQEPLEALSKDIKVLITIAQQAIPKISVSNVKM